MAGKASWQLQKSHCTLAARISQRKNEKIQTSLVQKAAADQYQIYFGEDSQQRN